MAVLNILMTFFIILLIVFIHELGHYLAARKAGVRVLEFAIGFGPIAYKWKSKKGHWISIRFIPLGGFVRVSSKRIMDMMQASIDEQENPEKQEKMRDKFWFKNADNVPGIQYEDSTFKSKIVFLTAGIILNLLTAFIIFIILGYMKYAGVAELERYTFIHKYSNGFVQFFGSMLDVLRTSVFVFEAIGKSFGKLFTLHSEGGSIVQLLKNNSHLHTDSKNWAIYMLYLFGAISANMFVFNLIPIPPLDGWRILEAIIVKTKKRPISEKVEVGVLLAGVIFMFTWLIVNIVVDIIH